MKQLTDFTDEELAVRYINGDNDAFDILLERNGQPVYAYIFFMVRDKDLADDIFQETFVKVITKLQENRYVPSGKFSAWCIRIAHNLLVDGFRNQKVRRVVEVPGDNDLSNFSSGELMERNIEDDYVYAQVMDDLRKMVAQLPCPQREVVYMRFYQQLSFKEIAELTNVSINTSLGRMRYALLNLRRMARKHHMELKAWL